MAEESWWRRKNDKGKGDGIGAKERKAFKCGSLIHSKDEKTEDLLKMETYYNHKPQRSVKNLWTKYLVVNYYVKRHSCMERNFEWSKESTTKVSQGFCELFKVRKIIFLLKDITLPMSEAERSLVWFYLNKDVLLNQFKAILRLKLPCWIPSYLIIVITIPTILYIYIYNSLKSIGYSPDESNFM